MTDKTLSKARGLNTIADPRDFKGTSGRRRTSQPDGPAPEPRPDARRVPRPETAPTERREASSPPPDPPRARSESTAAPTHAERVGAQAPVATPSVPTHAESAPAKVAPHRAVNPGVNRKRRELSVPHVLADALERTGINPADVVMAAYRRHAEAIVAGEGGRMMAKGRTRLRLSISDAEFDQLTRLGHARGWNRSETVSVLLTMELLGRASTQQSNVGPT